MFSNFYINMVAAAEFSGALSSMLQKDESKLYLITNDDTSNEDYVLCNNVMIKLHLSGLPELFSRLF